MHYWLIMAYGQKVNTPLRETKHPDNVRNECLNNLLNEVQVHLGQKQQRVVQIQLVQTQSGKQALIEEATVHFLT